MIKMIVTDLDGTILDIERKMSKSTEEYLISLKERGYVVVIATGRNFASAKKHTNGARFANYLISDGGACTYDPYTEEILFKNNLSKEQVKSILEYWDETFAYVEICDKDSYLRYTGEQDIESFLADIEDITHLSIKFILNEQAEKTFFELQKEFPGLSFLLMQDSFKSDKSIEVSSKNVSKYAAIKKLADLLNIKNDEIVAFGDSPNDLDMIKNCGFGVSMKNALDEVKKVSDATTVKDHNDDGMTDFLKNILGSE